MSRWKYQATTIHHEGPPSSYENTRTTQIRPALLLFLAANQKLQLHASTDINVVMLATCNTSNVLFALTTNSLSTMAAGDAAISSVQHIIVTFRCKERDRAADTQRRLQLQFGEELLSLSSVFQSFKDDHEVHRTDGM
jgi:hypothetical protein